MNSSGVLAFYLSENENPDLWRAMAQMSQNERAEVFLSALSYFLVGDDEDMYAASADSEEENNAPQTQSLFSVPRAQSSYSSQSSYKSSSEQEVIAEPRSDFTLNANKGTNADSKMNTDNKTYNEWVDDRRVPEQEEARGARHTLTPTFSRPQARPSQVQLKRMLDEQSQKLSAEKSGSRPNVGPDAYVGPDTKMKERMPRMRPPAQLAAQAGLRDRRSAQPDRRSAQPVVQPEIKDVALDELFSDAPGTMNHNLRGLDFVLKNIIGEENDEAVLEAIRRIKIADSY